MNSKVAFGIVIIFLGVVTMVGSATGQEAVMLSALFYGNNGLVTSSGGAAAKPKSSSIVSTVTGIVGGELKAFPFIP